MKKIAIIGGYQTAFGELWEKSLGDLIEEAGIGAISDSGIEKNDVNCLYLGNMAAGRFVGQEHVAAFAADCLSLKVPAIRCEAACASGALAFSQACIKILSGKAETALVIGAEKMTDVIGSEAVTTLMGAGDSEWESSIGLTFAGLYALMARAHMHRYKTTREQLAMVAVNNHKNGQKNEKAQFRFPITVDDVIKSAVIADPLRLLDCSPITDGAASVIVASEDYVQKKKIENPVWVLGSSHGSDSIGLHDRADITEMASVKKAAKDVFDESGLKHKDIDVVELHDCFTINEIIGLESMGFCEKGKGGTFVEESELPTNTTGGLKSCGHPVGATGVRQIIDIYRQLKGVSINQVKGAEHGLALNVGGSGATAIIHILGVE
ncbi:MAG: thiolase domain-containing protein [Candidatus Aenigmarchaeota archaeon]|nr:thiolase domain-containing protein [Candidatus Aenigmarchaeota archaeon]